MTREKLTQSSYYLDVPERALTEQEFALVKRMAVDLPSAFRDQLKQLMVVGRCGCGNCPTIFFRRHTHGAKEVDLVSMQGTDISNGLVGVVLMADGGMLTQLDFYSIDGHEPWLLPKLETLSLMQ
ncbi:hypothetical protein [Polaromonas sp. UC242_47]|uniref:hypothetical protein n=1 Tax=Polaromonas sp. UC242_47 TaxID=3374626 RepID=UPI0037949499